MGIPKYPHGYSTEEKDLAPRSASDTNRLHGSFRYRDNRADVIAGLDGQIDCLGSISPLRTSYVTQDGVSIREEETK